jgi:DNA-binding CsgD family transcriptional regulator
LESEAFVSSFDYFCAMKSLRHIVWCFVLLLLFACAKHPIPISEEAVQQAQIQYDSGVVCLQCDSLRQGLPYFFRVADGLEMLPEDMDSAAMQLTAQAYSQMAFVFRMKMENNAEIDALRRAMGYQERIADTPWLMQSWLSLAGAFQVLEEPDSAQVYLNRLLPCTDTVTDVEIYLQAVDLQSALCFDRGQYDSCFRLCREGMAFKARRGMDTKNDSVSLGMFLFFSGDHAAAKPCLLKVVDADCDDVQTGYVMSLAMQAFEEEGLADSAAYCQSFIKTFVGAEMERFDDGLALQKEYGQFKDRRDARLQALREEKEARKAKGLRIVCVVVALLLMAAVAFVVHQRRYRKRMTQEHEAVKRDLQEAHGALETQAQEAVLMKVRAIYEDKRNNTYGRILEVFNATHPDALAKLKAAHPDLSEVEIGICVLSLYPFRMKEIADILNLRENTVSKYRTNIKKKTQTDTIERLWEPFIG